MTAIATAPATSFLGMLLSSAARALALSGVVGLGLAALRVKTTTVRLFAWTAVLYASLAMPLLQITLPPVQVAAPALLQQAWNRAPAKEIFSDNSELSAAERRQNTAHGVSRGEKVDAEKPQRGERSSSAFIPQSALVLASPTKQAPPAITPLASPHPAMGSLPASIPWSLIAAQIYLAVALLLLLRFVIGLAYSRRLVQAALPIAHPRLTFALASRASALKLASIPRALESEFISVPLTMGVLRSTILLPAGWHEWDDPKLNAVLAHEVSHVARRDALTQCLSLLHRAIFWFSPLAWWLDRHLADLAEQASDEDALLCGADRKDYARTLLEFFSDLQAAPGRVWWQGVAMAKAGQAEKRLERILSWKGSVAMHLKKSIAVALLTLAVPVVYLAASVHAANHSDLRGANLAQDQAPPPAPRPAAAAAPASSPDPAPAPIAGPTGGVSVPPLPGLAPMAGVVPLSPMPAIAPIAPIGRSYQSRSSSRNGYSYSYGNDDDQRFVIVTGKSDSLTMSGSIGDAKHVEKLRKTISGDFIWFQMDEKSYIIRDQATIDRARKFWEPQEELGKQQEALGAQQEALGKQQEELGSKMEQVQVSVPDMTAELDKLKAKLQKLGAHATLEQIGDLQSEIGDLQGKIGEIQSQAGEQQGKLGEQMGALGEKQGKLGEQQGELGSKQAELARQANRQMKQLLEEAIQKGTAQPEL
jgi:beta-lactamase regulating signal transducer with metallopeptidase domain